MRRWKPILGALRGEALEEWQLWSAELLPLPPRA
jgi:hypothetical protein